MAQLRQRGWGWAKRATQASHSGWAGQARQTAHWPGRRPQALRSSAASSDQYTRSHLMADQRPPTIDPAAARHWDSVAPARSPWLHEEVARRMEDRLQWITDGAARPGPIGSRCAAACRPRRCSSAATRKAECFVAESRRTAPRWRRGMSPAVVAAAGRAARHHGPAAGRRRPDALGQHGPAYVGRPAGADRAMASRARDRRLPDVLLPGSGHLARTAGAIRRARLAACRRTISPTCTIGATCWCTPALPSPSWTWSASP